MKRGQNGFGVIETLLVLILLSILGFTGYYVYHSQKNTNSTYDNTAKVSSNTQRPSSAASNKFVFKELGLEFNLPSDLNGLKYDVQHFSDGDAYNLTTPSFTQANEQCYGQQVTGDGPSFASISKQTGTYDPNKALGYGVLKQFSDYYISISFPNGITSCDQPGIDEQLVLTKAHALQGSFQTAFKATVTVVK